MATTINGYPNDKANGNPLSADEVNTLSDGSELHHVNLCELFGTGVIGATDWNLGIVAGQIALAITAGQGIVGDAGERKVCATESSVTITTTQGIAASNTYYIFKKRDLGTSGDDTTGFVGQLSSTPPADSILIGSAVFNGTEATSVDNLPQGRVNLQNPIVLAGLAADRPTFGVVGRFWFSTDTGGGTLYYDTGAAWQQVAAASGGTFTSTVKIIPASDVNQLILTKFSGQTADILLVRGDDDATAIWSIAPSGSVTSQPQTSGAPVWNLYGYGTANNAGQAIRFRAARNTRTSQQAVQADDFLMDISAGGAYDASTFHSISAAFRAKAAETFSAGAGGTFFDWSLMLPGAASLSAIARLYGNGLKIQQGVSAAPVASALTEWVSTSQGLLLPRMTTAQRDAISSPAAGLQVIDSDLNAESIYGVRWKWTPGVLFMQTADGTLNTSAAETSIVGTGIGSMVLPHSFWKVGKTIRFRISGYYGTTGTPTLQFKFKLDGTTVIDSGAITMGSGVSNKQFVFEGEITCRSVGVSGTLRAMGRLWTDTTLTPIPGTANVTSDTTMSNVSDTMSVTAQWSASSASNALVSTNLLAEVLP